MKIFFYKCQILPDFRQGQLFTLTCCIAVKQRSRQRPGASQAIILRDIRVEPEVGFNIFFQDRKLQKVHSVLCQFEVVIQIKQLLV